MTTLSAVEFQRLVQPHHPRMFRLAMRLTRQPSDAGDLVQEALLRAWSNWSRVNHDANLGAYLARIVMNTFISWHRHGQVEQAAEGRGDLCMFIYGRERVAASNDPETAWTAADLPDEILAAFGEVPDAYLSVLRLVDIEECSYADAASKLGIPIGTVMSRLHRARKIMKSALGPYARRFGIGIGEAVA